MGMLQSCRAEDGSNPRYPRFDYIEGSKATEALACKVPIVLVQIGLTMVKTNPFSDSYLNFSLRVYYLGPP